MVSVLRTLQAEWNALVPQAQALGIRRVRLLNLPLETIDHRRAKLEWLRNEIAQRSGLQALQVTLQDTTALQTVVEPAIDLSIYTFGVELEFIMPVGFTRHTLALRLQQDAGIECRAEDYNHATRGSWKLVTDGSLGDYSRGAELVSPVLRGDDGMDQLRRACLTLKAVGCKVTKKCGLHVHVGAQSWEVRAHRNIAKAYYFAQRHVDTFMPPSRRGDMNNFCQNMELNLARLDHANSAADVARACSQDPNSPRGWGRYKKLNFQSFWQHGTWEFRHHQGTVEADKALPWVRFCLHLAHAAQTTEPVSTREAPLRGFATLDDVFNYARLPEADRAFFRSRVEYFRTVEENAVQRAANPTLRRPRAGSQTGRIQIPSAGVDVAAEVNAFEHAASTLRDRAMSRG